MSHFVFLGKLTHQGITGIKQVRKRYAAFRQVVKSKGGKVVAEYATLGRYDYVFLVDLPHSKAALEVSLAMGSKGNVTFETLRAFPFKEFIMVAERA
jgi:uncharacterized protein with GYD domain